MDATKECPKGLGLLLRSRQAAALGRALVRLDEACAGRQRHTPILRQGGPAAHTRSAQAPRGGGLAHLKRSEPFK